MDIGTLTGHIAIEDQLTGKLTQMAFQVKQFAHDVDGAFGAMAIGATAVVAAFASVATGIVALGSKGSTILGVENAFNRLAKAAGSTGDALIEGLDKGLRSTVDSMEEMQAVSNAMTAGVRLSADDLELMGKAAREMGKATGTDATQGLETLSTALTTGRTRALAMAGIVVDLSTAEQDYADSLGISASQLTENQKLEAKRIQILQATQEYVDRLGDSQLSLKERVQQVGVAIGNWFDDLAKGIAQSPAVIEAFDTIRDAMQETFGESSQSLLKTILGWVDQFANAVTAYGPTVIKVFGGIYDSIRGIWTTVTEAWNTIPDWLKAIGRDAILAGGALLVAGKSLGTLTTVMEKVTGEEMTGGVRSLVGDWGGLSSALATTTTTIRNLPDAFAKVGEGISTARKSINALADGFVAAAGSSATFFAQLGTGLVVAASVVAVGTAGYQAWKLWGESAERAAAAERQVEYDTANLARINEKLGTTYNNLDDAVVAAREKLGEMQAETVQLTEAEKAAMEAARQHEEAVSKLYGSYADAAAKVDLTTEVFERLTGVQKLNYDVQKQLIAAFDERIERGGQLTEKEKDYYEAVLISNKNLDDSRVKMLEKNKVTLEHIQSLKAMGFSEAEIAMKLGTTTKALKDYESQLSSLDRLQKQYNDQQAKLSMTSHEYAVRGYQLEYEEAVKALDKTSLYYQQTADKLAAIRNAKIAAEGSSWSTIAEQSREALQAQADAALEDYKRMQYSGLTFMHEVLDAQLKKYRDLQEATQNWGGETEKKVEDITQKVTILTGAWASYNSGLNESITKVQTLHGEIISLAEAERRRTSGGSMTYDLSTEQGIQEYFQQNTAARTNLTNQQIMARVEKGATLEDLVKSGAINPYGGFGSGLNIPGAASGGLVRVGEDGPEIVQLPGGAQVYPTGTGPGGGGPTVVVNIGPVNGTADQLVQVVKSRLMRELKTIRQFPSS